MDWDQCVQTLGSLRTSVLLCIKIREKQTFNGENYKTLNGSIIQQQNAIRVLETMLQEGIQPQLATIYEKIKVVQTTAATNAAQRAASMMTGEHARVPDYIGCDSFDVGNLLKKRQQDIDFSDAIEKEALAQLKTHQESLEIMLREEQKSKFDFKRAIDGLSTRIGPDK